MGYFVIGMRSENIARVYLYKRTTYFLSGLVIFLIFIKKIKKIDFFDYNRFLLIIIKILIFLSRRVLEDE